MSVSHPSSIRPFFTFKPRRHVFPNAFSSKRETVLLPNDDMFPTADVFTECSEENILPNGTLLPNSAHRSVSFLYQFLVSTAGPDPTEPFLYYPNNPLPLPPPSHPPAAASLLSRSPTAPLPAAARPSQPLSHGAPKLPSPLICPPLPPL
jgi:hypothetical protein